MTLKCSNLLFLVPLICIYSVPCLTNVYIQCSMPNKCLYSVFHALKCLYSVFHALKMFIFSVPCLKNVYIQCSMLLKCSLNVSVSEYRRGVKRNVFLTLLLLLSGIIIVNTSIVFVISIPCRSVFKQNEKK